jgi:tRNA threonylcarbamoyladenosine biosynthesis protein TsaE
VSTRTVVTASEAETIDAGAELARALPAGTVLLISGELGAGKTAFVRGLAKGLGLDPADVTSPTFTLVHEYRGGRLPLVHIDLYRLERADLDDIGLDDDLARAGLVAIEWPERLLGAPVGAVTVRIDDRGGDRRAIEIATSSKFRVQSE